MKIWMINNHLSLGGASRQFLELAHYIFSEGHDLKIFSEGLNLKKFPDKFHDLPFVYKSKKIENYSPKNIVSNIFALRKLIKSQRDRPDILNPHSFPSYFLTPFSGAPSVWMCNEPLLWVSPKVSSRIFSPLRLIDRYFAGKQTFITVLDEKNKTRIEKFYNLHSRVVWSGVDFDFFSKKVRPLWGPRGFHMLQVGNIFHQKNQMLSVEVLGKLVKEGINATLTLVGKVVDQKYFEGLVHRIKALGLDNKVSFTGTLVDEQLVCAYASADLILFPAIYQSWGLTPIEALCQGKPSLVSSDAGVSEVIGKEDMGLVANPDLNSFFQGAKYVHSNKNKLKTLTRRGKKFVKNNFTWKHYSQRMETIFNEVLNSPRQ